MTVVFEGKQQVAVYQVLVIRGALRLYYRTGRKVNRNAGPKVLLAQASKITGKSYRTNRNACGLAMDDLTDWLQTNASKAFPNAADA